MKRTTYILIGLFVAGLCVLVGGMFMIFLFRKAIHFQSTEFARRADNQRSAGLPGGLADSNKAVYART